MNFEDILKEWDKRTAGGPGSKKGAGGEVPSAKNEEESSQPDRASERRRLLHKKPDATIDLHGLTQAEAWEALDAFFTNSRSEGHEKVLIIHGKGNHADSEGVLKALTVKFIERCPIAGQSGRSHASMGGAGATWVILKNEELGIKN
jgi:DNA-nicking Smr family endonuclease